MVDTPNTNPNNGDEHSPDGAGAPETGTSPNSGTDDVQDLISWLHEVYESDDPRIRKTIDDYLQKIRQKINNILQQKKVQPKGSVRYTSKTSEDTDGYMYVEPWGPEDFNRVRGAFEEIKQANPDAYATAQTELHRVVDPIVQSRDAEAGQERTQQESGGETVRDGRTEVPQTDEQKVIAWFKKYHPKDVWAKSWEYIKANPVKSSVVTAGAVAAYGGAWMASPVAMLAGHTAVLQWGWSALKFPFSANGVTTILLGGGAAAVLGGTKWGRKVLGKLWSYVNLNDKKYILKP